MRPGKRRLFTTIYFAARPACAWCCCTCCLVAPPFDEHTSYDAMHRRRPAGCLQAGHVPSLARRNALCTQVGRRVLAPAAPCCACAPLLPPTHGAAKAAAARLPTLAGRTLTQALKGCCQTPGGAATCCPRRAPQAAPCTHVHDASQRMHASRLVVDPRTGVQHPAALCGRPPTPAIRGVGTSSGCHVFF